MIGNFTVWWRVYPPGANVMCHVQDEGAPGEEGKDEEYDMMDIEMEDEDESQPPQPVKVSVWDYRCECRLYDVCCEIELLILN